MHFLIELQLVKPFLRLLQSAKYKITSSDAIKSSLLNLDHKSRQSRCLGVEDSNVLCHRWPASSKTHKYLSTCTLEGSRAWPMMHTCGINSAKVTGDILSPFYGLEDFPLACRMGKRQL